MAAKSRNLVAAAASAFLAVALFGCASRIPAGRPAYVYVADNGIVTFRGDNLKASELPERLAKAGATPSTQIFLIAQGDVPRGFLTQMAMDCGRAGFPSCTIRDRMKITIEKGTPVVNSMDAEMRTDRPQVISRRDRQ